MKTFDSVHDAADKLGIKINSAYVLRQRGKIDFPNTMPESDAPESAIDAFLKKHGRDRKAENARRYKAGLTWAEWMAQEYKPVRAPRRVKVDGKVEPLRYAAEKTGIDLNVFTARYNRGDRGEKLTRPARTYKKRAPKED